MYRHDRASAHIWINNGGEVVSGIFAAVAYFFKEVMVFVSYVKNNAFPQPLSEGDELTLFLMNGE